VFRDTFQNYALHNLLRHLECPIIFRLLAKLLLAVSSSAFAHGQGMIAAVCWVEVLGVFLLLMAFRSHKLDPVIPYGKTAVESSLVN